AALVGWRSPRLPIGGGKLIARGVPEGPAVARTLRRIEDRWVESGFPHGDRFEAIVAEALESEVSR
ncbi:MAG: CCA tRNA nucleotidyltransferase, partial [Sphingomonas sp.]|nr:CCA tRNA nucleotidyltransferase [Sphingomonas sp.]